MTPQTLIEATERVLAVAERWSCAAPGRDIVVSTPGIRICPVMPCGSRSISRYNSSNDGTRLAADDMVSRVAPRTG
jgi:hypothetical protein